MACFELCSITPNANAMYYRDVFSKGKIKVIKKFVLLSLLCFFNTFVFYWLCLYLSKNSISLIKNRALEQGEGTVSIYVCHALSVENICNEITAPRMASDNEPKPCTCKTTVTLCCPSTSLCTAAHLSSEKKEGMGRVYKGYTCRKTCQRLLQRPQAKFKNFFTDMVQGLLQ